MKFLVIGCGSIGKRHLLNLQRLGMEDLTGFDVRPEARTEVAERLGLPVVEDIQKALDKGPQAVLICTPTSLHIEYALQAVRAGAHLFIEKPIAHSLTSIDELLNLAEADKRTILVGCNFRFERGMVRIKTMLDRYEIGKVLGARGVFGHYLPDWHPWEDYRQGYSARKELGGGIILDAVHEVDYIQWLIGEVRSVACFAGKVSNLEIDVEDYADLLLRLGNGVTAELHVDYFQRPYQRSLEIYGTEGTIKWSFHDRSVRWFLSSNETWQSLSWQHDPEYSIDEMYLAEMRHFVDCVRGKDKPALDGHGGKRVLQVALAAKESAMTGKVVDVS